MVKTNRLFTAKTADGSSETIGWKNNEGAIFVGGEPDGGTVTLECSKDKGASWFSTGLTFTAAGVKNIDINGECHLRVTSSSSGASTSWDVWLDIVDEQIAGIV